ncbi:MAG TPA: M20/M25/M40 family metallo-hydrolase, partial [Polyangia bacterium]
YTSPPHQLVERDGRYYGLGTADTKGAIAAILEALRARRDAQGNSGPQEDVAVLFSGDEEKHASVIRWFLAEGHARGLERAVICEPTGLRVGHRHRGIAASTATTVSPGGHSSRADELPSPIVTLARAALALYDVGQEHLGRGPAGFQGLCLNVAGISGGVAFNVIPARAELELSIRPAPGSDTEAILGALEAAARAAVGSAPLVWQNTHINPPFATRDLAAFAPLLGASLVSAPLDLGFWTEAALFAEAGIDAVVFGPGDITEAHAADEFVEIGQLEGARDIFRNLLCGGAAA